MRKWLVGVLGMCLLASAGVRAQQPAAAKPPTPEQIQQMQQAMMVRQMQMMSLLFDVRPSKLGFDETLSAIRAGASKRGWKVGEVQDLQAMMQKNGAKDAKPMKMLSLCPAGANEKVGKASGGKAPPLPCRATVFEGKDGKVYVMHINYGNMAKAMAGEVGKALSEIGAEEDALFRDLLS